MSPHGGCCLNQLTLGPLSYRTAAVREYENILEISGGHKKRLLFYKSYKDRFYKMKMSHRMFSSLSQLISQLMRTRGHVVISLSNIVSQLDSAKFYECWT